MPQDSTLDSSLGCLGLWSHGSTVHCSTQSTEWCGLYSSLGSHRVGVWEEPIRKGDSSLITQPKKNQAGSHPQELEGPQSVCLCTGDGVTVGPQPALQFLDLGFAPSCSTLLLSSPCTPPHGAQLHPSSKCNSSLCFVFIGVV